MDSKQKAKKKAEDLKDELEALFGGEFRTLCNCGYAGSFDIHRYGTPTVYIGGSIFSDSYYVTVWDKENGKQHLYNSGYKAITKAEMINALSGVMKRKELPQKQMELF